MRRCSILAITALCAVAMSPNNSAGAGGSPPKGDNHVTTTGDGIAMLAVSDSGDEGARDMILGDRSECTDTGDDIIGDGILAASEGARDIGGTGDTPLRDKVPIGTFMSDKPGSAGDRIAA